MTALQTLARALYVGLGCLVLSSPLLAQPVSDLPRAEYYVARELFGIGRTLEASDGFQTALNRARRVGEQRWVDSIPPLIMLGECYYQQGNLAMALEQYDAALLLALANPGWIDQVDVQAEQLAELESTKRVNWLPKSRSTKTVVVPSGLQLSIDPTQAQSTPQGGVVAPVSVITQLDVTEVLRTMSIALMRRWELLGPLAKHSPLAAPLDAMFARNPMQRVPWLTASWSILRGVSSLGSNARVDARQLVREGTLIANQADYYLSPQALMVLGKLDARAGNYPDAMVSFQDAALLAAQFEQLAVVAEALHELTACAAASGRLDLLDPLQRIATWANKKSSSVQAAALIGAGELAVYAEDFVMSDKLLRQAAVVVRGREVSLPRAQALLAYTTSLLAFGQNRRGLGLSNLELALKLARGSATTGAVVESVFQTQLTLNLLASNALTAVAAESILAETLAEPSERDWQLSPLEVLAELTTARDPAFIRLLELAIARGAQADELVQLMDRTQRQRLYESLPLGGRLMAWRHALGGQPGQLQPEDRKVVEAALKRYPTLLASGQRIESLVTQLRQAPLPLDERKLSADAKKAYLELEELSTQFESQLAFLSLQRRHLGRVAPPAASLPNIQQQLDSGDMVIAFVMGGQQVYAMAIRREQTHVWQVSEPAKLDAALAALLAEIGLVRAGKPSVPDEVTTPTAAWRATAEKIASQLFPAEVHTMLNSSQRVILVPHDRLWYIPYEMLPHTAQGGSAAWIVQRAVTYVPTLGSIELAFGTRPALQRSVGIVGSFFALDPPSNDAAANAIARSVPDSTLILLSQKLSVAAPNWLKLATDQLWVASPIESGENGWEAAVLPLGKPLQAHIGLWFETPRTSPAIVALPGLTPVLKQGKMGRGNDIFLPVCAMLFSGTKTACISRWPVGGGSTKVFLQRELEELQTDRPSAALRRSVLALWTEQFLLADEPLLLPAVKESAPLVPGNHPLLWSGYMSVGDWKN
jgi:tetratricopeptide (TPR) repeat protein